MKIFEAKVAIVTGVTSGIGCVTENQSSSSRGSVLDLILF